MSIRKPTCVTPRRRDAQRRNAQQSTGPRSQAGKERMKMNALKHGCDAAPENEAAVMRALGEDPEQFAALKRDLISAFPPGDAFSDRQVDDLARLYWRRNRLERIETGLMREALEAAEERRRALARALADVTFQPSQYDAVELHLPQPAHPCVRLRLLISFWGVIREQVRQRVFSSEQKRLIEVYYQGEGGWRPRQIGYLLGLFGSPRFLQPHDEARLQQYAQERFGGEAAVAALYQELLRLVEEQKAAEEAAFAAEMQAQERKDAMARDSCLAPEDETASMLLRLEMALDRAIDRKVRILMALGKERQREPSAAVGAPLAGARSGTGAAVGGPLAGARPGQAQGPPHRNEAKDRAAEELSRVVGLNTAEAGRDTPSSVCDSGQGAEASPSLRETQTPNGRGLGQPTGLRASAAQTESMEDENAPETQKSPEQSQNVIENKGQGQKGEGLRA